MNGRLRKQALILHEHKVETTTNQKYKKNRAISIVNWGEVGHEVKRAKLTAAILKLD